MEKPTIIRPLSQIEQAWTLSDQAFPLTAICILKLVDGPVPSLLEAGLKKLQDIHPAFRIAIRQKGKKLFFEEQSPPPGSLLEVLERNTEDQWRNVAEELLNTSIDTGKAPLMRCVYLFTPQTTQSELILAFHHSIIDAASLNPLLHQLLQYCAGGAKAISQTPYPLIPGAESLFPKKFKGISLWFRLLIFFLQQIREEQYYRKGRKHLPHLTIPSAPQNRIHHISLDPEHTDRLIEQSRKRGVSMPGLISSALLLAVWEMRYHKKNSTHRSVIFASLRPFLYPPLAPEKMGCYLSMLRFTSTLDSTTTLWTEAKRMSQSIYEAGKRGDRFLYSFLSKAMVQMTLRFRNQRLGTTALSYAGPLPLQPTYGSIQVRDVHGYITNNPLGPEYSAVGKIFDGRLSIDIQYLTAEMKSEEANSIANRVREMFIKATQGNT